MKSYQKMLSFFLFTGLIAFSIFITQNPAQAKKITSLHQAEKKAKKQVKNATVTDLEKDRKDGVTVYEIQLRKGSREYDLTYRASNGKLISYGWELPKRTVPKASGTISKSKCKKLAQKKTGNAKIISIVQKYDDGALCYKVKAKKGKKTYSLEFYAGTGKLLEYEWKLAASNTKSGYIGTAKAKKLALSKIPNARVIKVEFDTDDGIPVYDVELIKGSYEYEVKIHAKTGKILVLDKDWND